MRYRYSLADEYFEKPIIQTLSSVMQYIQESCVPGYLFAHHRTRDHSMCELSVYHDNYANIWTRRPESISTTKIRDDWSGIRTKKMLRILTSALNSVSASEAAFREPNSERSILKTKKKDNISRVSRVSSKCGAHLCESTIEILSMVDFALTVLFTASYHHLYSLNTRS